MRRQDQEPRVAHAHQHHQAEVRRVVVGQGRPAVREIFAILERRLVAVVAVGDEDGFPAIRPDRAPCASPGR